MHYEEIGEEHATLMVFIHGGGVSGWMWKKQVDYFSTKYHCLIPDLPEHGASRNEGSFTIASSAEKIIALIKEKGKGKSVVAIGFSLGAQVLLSVLSKQPNLIDVAIVNSALVKPIPLAHALTKSMTFALPLVRIKAFSNIQAKSMFIQKEDFDTYYEESSQIEKEAFVRIMTENMSFTIPSSLSETTSKLLVTVGEKERKVMKDSMKEIIESVPHSKGLVIPATGHGVSLANPFLFQQIVEEWVENERIVEKI